jgi:uncharacterized protein involved in outer membrane biogenesis
MTSTSRKVLLAVLALLLLIGAGLYFLGSNLNGIVTSVIEKQGSAALQTSVRVSGVDIRLSEASAAISGLNVGNPEGFSGNAIELGGFSVQLDASSLTSDTVVIKDITVDGARINVLQQGASNNLTELLAGLQQGPSDDTTATDDTTAAEGPGTKLIIDRFSLQGASASISNLDTEEMSEVALATIVLRDIGRASNGATGAEIAEQILGPVLEAAIASAATQAIKDSASKKIGDSVGGFLKGIGGKKDE